MLVDVVELNERIRKLIDATDEVTEYEAGVFDLYAEILFGNNVPGEFVSDEVTDQLGVVYGLTPGWYHQLAAEEEK